MKSGAACPTAGVPAGCCSVSNQDPKPRGQRTELDAQTRRSCSERGGQTFFLQVNRQRGDKFRLATSLQPVPELRTGGRWFIKRSRDDTACRERINLRRVQATPGQVTPVAFVSRFDIFYPPRPFWLFFTVKTLILHASGAQRGAPNSPARLSPVLPGGRNSAAQRMLPEVPENASPARTLLRKVSRLPHMPRPPRASQLARDGSGEATASRPGRHP